MIETCMPTCNFLLPLLEIIALISDFYEDSSVFRMAQDNGKMILVPSLKI